MLFVANKMFPLPKITSAWGVIDRVVHANVTSLSMIRKAAAEARVSFWKTGGLTEVHLTIISIFDKFKDVEEKLFDPLAKLLR